MNVRIFGIRCPSTKRQTDIEHNVDMFYLYYNSNISDNILSNAFTFDVTVDLCTAQMRMLVSMTMTLM